MSPRLAFVHIEKTAGMTVHSVLKRSFGTDHVTVTRTGKAECFTPADYRVLRLVYPRLESIGGHWIKPFCGLDREIPRLRYWTFLREPLARCASMYQFQVKTMGVTEPFEEWIQLPRRRNFQTRKLALKGDFQTAKSTLDGFAVVGLTERFDESLLLLDQACSGRLDLRYRPTNVASDNSIARDLLEAPGPRRLLAEANDVDVRLYAYAVEEIFPRQIAAYAGDIAKDLKTLRAQKARVRPNLRLLLSEAKRHLLARPLLALWGLVGRRPEAE